MGFLSDVGRSNLPQVSQSIFGDIVKYKQMENQDTALAQNSLHQAQQMDMAQRHFAIQEAEAAQRKQEWLDNHTVEPLSDMRVNAEKQNKGATFKVLQEHLAPYVQTAPDGTEFVLRQDRKKVADLMAKDPNIRFRFATAELQGIQSQYDEASAKFDSAKKKLQENPNATLEEQQALTAKATDAKAQMDQFGLQKTQKQNEMMWTTPDLVKAMLARENKDQGLQEIMVGGKSMLVPKSMAVGQEGYHKPADEPNNDFKTFMAGEKEKNPNVTNAQISTAWHKMKVAEAAAAGATRGEAFAKSRPVQVIDRNTGRGKVISLADVEVANRLEPGRYEPIAGSPDYKADTTSLTNQVKVRDMMAGFIGNMNKQIDRMGEITKEVERFDTRLLNVPLVRARTMIKGSPMESKINMYLTEISSEMGKIASGASASVAELSVETRKKWETIHDKNLSINDMMSLLRETQHAGSIRLKSSEQIIADTKKRFGGGSAGGGNQGGGGGGKDPLGLGL